jgi:hypothetical protein
VHKWEQTGSIKNKKNLYNEVNTALAGLSHEDDWESSHVWIAGRQAWELKTEEKAHYRKRKEVLKEIYICL